MRRQHGDTIIEVVVAITVFSLVAVGAMTIMNSGLAMAQRSLETTLVRQQIDAQAEMLRFVHSRAQEDSTGEYHDLWSSIQPVTKPQQLLNVDTCPVDKIPNSIAFAPGATGVSLATEHVEPVTYARVLEGQSQGVSVQLAKVSGGRAYDAHIYACWYAPGLSRPMTTGTIVRLYDPSV